jgi:Zn-dependent protease
MNFDGRELLDLFVAWVALGVAFAFFFERGLLSPRGFEPAAFTRSLGISLATVGVGFLLHELAHKVVAVRFGQVAAFRADYSMLFLAVMGGLAGFIFAAPGAVHHRGRLTERERGLIALAGPATNVALVAAFLPVAFALPEIGWRGVWVNALLAGFNALPVRGIDGRTVLGWSKLAYALLVLVAVPLGLAALAPGVFLPLLP